MWYLRKQGSRHMYSTHCIIIKGIYTLNGNFKYISFITPHQVVIVFLQGTKLTFFGKEPSGS